MMAEDEDVDVGWHNTTSATGHHSKRTMKHSPVNVRAGREVLLKLLGVNHFCLEFWGEN